MADESATTGTGTGAGTKGRGSSPAVGRLLIIIVIIGGVFVWYYLKHLTKGTASGTGDPVGVWTMHVNTCAPTDGGTVGVRLTDSNNAGVGMIALADDVDGNLVRVMTPGGIWMVVPHDLCASNDVVVGGRGQDPNDPRGITGHVKIDCKIDRNFPGEVHADVTFENCH